MPTAKWDIEKAYSSFKSAVNSYEMPILLVKENSTGEGSNQRYYDEGGQTAGLFLEFYKAGIQDAMAQAQRWWTWPNQNLWNTLKSPNGPFYQYSIDREVFECEEGGFNQIIWELYHYNHDTPNTNNLIIDLQTRMLSSNEQPTMAQYVIAMQA